MRATSSGPNLISALFSPSWCPNQTRCTFWLTVWETGLVETSARVNPHALGIGAERLRLRQIMFAAPDVDAGHFTQLVDEFAGRAERFTLYASSRDYALEASQKIHKYPRAGDSGDGLVVTYGVDTVDATGVTTDLMGHSYYGDNRSIISDVFTLIRHGFAPADRPSLERHVRGETAYSRFKP